MPYDRESLGPVFASSRVLAFSQLGEEEKESFMRFVTEQRVQFFRDLDGSYVANVRLYDPSVIDAGDRRERETQQRKAARGGMSAEEGGRVVASALSGSSSALDYSVYPRLTSLLCPREAVKPKLRPLSWVMRLIEEVYDARYAKDTAELREEVEGDAGGAPAPAGPSPFPAFLIHFFNQRYGLKSLIDANAWELLFNVHALRREHVELDVFARFLEEFYDPDDLLFFLYVRSVTQKELGITFRGRWQQLGKAAAEGGGSPGGRSSASAAGSASGAGGAVGPAPVYLTLRDCQVVARVVFGSEADPLYRAFLAVVDRHLVSGGRAKGGRGGDSRRIEAMHFLHLALVEYHETRPADGGAADGSGAGDGYAGGPAGGLSVGDLDSRGGGGGGVDGGALKALLEALGEEMHRVNEGYLDSLLAASAGGLPAEVAGQIRSEVQAQLEAKVDGLLAVVITATQAGGGGGSTGVPEHDALVAQFGRVLASSAGGANDAALSSFCSAVVGTEEVRSAIEPLVSLLVTYASSRLAAPAPDAA